MGLRVLWGVPGVLGVPGGSGGVWGGVPEGKTPTEGGPRGSGTRVSVGGVKWSKTCLGLKVG